MPVWTAKRLRVDRAILMAGAFLDGSRQAQRRPAPCRKPATYTVPEAIDECTTYHSQTSRPHSPIMPLLPTNLVVQMEQSVPVCVSV